MVCVWSFLPQWAMYRFGVTKVFGLADLHKMRKPMRCNYTSMMKASSSWPFRRKRKVGETFCKLKDERAAACYTSGGAFVNIPRMRFT